MSEEKSEYTPDLYTLEDENGVEQTFEMLDALETEDGQRYFALVPYAENPEDALSDSDELVILKAEMEGDEEILVSIDDDDEFDRIGQIFLKRIEEMFEDDDYEDEE
ncbi:MAG: DUF1292 domain-containing protein [Ruminococcus sp.]|nr:DUF1292 domain-containing protein [Ruminococcus sp.]